MKNTKKRVFAIALAVCIFVLSIAGSSLAYFTDTEEYTNVFTAGNVDITLTYASTTVDQDAGETVLELESENVYPGQKFDIDATITNIGSEKAYVGAIITLADANLDSVITVAGEGDNIPVALSKFITDLVADGADYTVKVVTADDKKTITIFVIKMEALGTAPTDNSCEIFGGVKIPTEWDNKEMEAFSGLSLNVKAYATQTGGFNTAEEALTTAFDGKGWEAYPVAP